MKRSKNAIEEIVVEDEEFYNAPQVDKVKGKQLSLESQVVISILAGVNFALFYFLIFMIQ
ncbi:hypothetical protein LNTAR_13742 [Lentisphaera araneosa HTCC2155]|uniref:Uncharacterized protein n=1 Tax=Lentisphaera araneosa HTCC2155 TaxID=313628 RepID=A6DH00_9BACT|nr:hypothetical protein [Lentisphaera araneosa]EDM28883.1 hypothetical protein LNTAR_13742 [Lentisphaera araneosa HTCC2155]